MSWFLGGGEVGLMMLFIRTREKGKIRYQTLQIGKMLEKNSARERERERERISKNYNSA